MLFNVCNNNDVWWKLSMPDWILLMYDKIYVRFTYKHLDLEIDFGPISFERKNFNVSTLENSWTKDFFLVFCFFMCMIDMCMCLGNLSWIEYSCEWQVIFDIWQFNLQRFQVEVLYVPILFSVHMYLISFHVYSMSVKHANILNRIDFCHYHFHSHSNSLLI